MTLFKVPLTEKANKIWSYFDCFFIASFVFSVPAFSDRSGVYHALSLFFIGLVIVSLAAHLLLTKNFRFSFPLVSFIVFGISVFVSCIFSGFANVSSTIFSALFLLVIFTFYFSSPLADIRKVLFSVALGGFFFSIYFFVIYHSEILSFDFSRIGEYFTNVNRVGDSFGISFVASIVILFFFTPKKRFWRVVFSFFSVLFLSFSAFTGSKAVLFLDVISLLFALLFFSPQKRTLMLMICLLLFPIVLYFGQTPALSTVFSRFLELFYFLLGDSRLDPSSSERMSMFAQAFYYYGQRPLFGFGIDAFSSLGAFGMYSHNTISELLCDFGIFGFLSYEAPLVYTILSLNKNDKNTFYSALVLLIAIFFLQTSFPVFLYKMNSLLYALFCSFSLRMRVDDSNARIYDSREKMLVFEVQI
jgi:O-antigen ligase